MTSIFRSRLEAEELDAALEGRAGSEVEQRHRELLDTVQLLTGHPAVSPRPEFATDLRARLLRAAETDLVAVPAEPRRAPPVAPSTRRRRVGTLAASLVIVGGTAGMAAAAQGALPGEPLYPLKRGAEQVETGLRFDEAAQGRSELRHARARLDEALALQDGRAGTDDASLLVASLEDFRTSAEAGADLLFEAYDADADPADVTAVRDFTLSSLSSLDRLGADADPSLEPALLDAADTLVAIDRRASELCSDCGSATALATPETLSSAASAASLEALLQRPAEQAGLDAAALDQLDRDQVAALVRAAETAAEQTPEPSGSARPALPDGEDWPVAERSESARQAVETELERAGRPVRTTVRETTRAVDDLVTGIDRSVGEITQGLRDRTRTDTPLDDGVGRLTDTVDSAVEGVTDVTGALSGRTRD